MSTRVQVRPLPIDQSRCGFLGIAEPAGEPVRRLQASEDVATLCLSFRTDSEAALHYFSGRSKCDGAVPCRRDAVALRVRAR